MAYFTAACLIIAGLGVFMLGMNALRNALNSAAGDKMRVAISRLPKNRFVCAGAGMGVTAILGSSSAVTAFTVSLTGSGAFTLMQAAAVIMGANAGTALTGLLFAAGSDVLGLVLILPVFPGACLCAAAKKPAAKLTGEVLCGFGAAFAGLYLLNGGVESLAGLPLISGILSAADNPLLLLLLGAGLSGLLQSSAAVNAAVLSLAGSGGMSAYGAAFVVLGTNVGTCVTALATGAGAGREGRRAAVIHFLFNFFGAAVFALLFLLLGNGLTEALLSALGAQIKTRIAVFNLLQNVISAFLMLPFTRALCALSTLVVRENKIRRKI